MKLRIKLVSLLFFVAFAALIVRLFFWQILNGQRLSSEARAQYQAGRNIEAPRGNVLASDGTWLAARADSWLVYASLPDLKEDPRRVADKLAPFFVEEDAGRKELLEEIDRLAQMMDRNGVVWSPLKHNVSNQAKENIAALNIEGIGFEREETRVYPEASAAAHLLGFVGKDEDGENVGYFGLEGYYNLTLSGKPGFVAEELDARGIPIPIGDNQEVSAIGGVDLLANIDKSIQLSLDKKLLEGIEKYGAKGGTAIVMDPKTGAIIGMSSYPSYDPASYQNFGNEYFKNPAVSDTFEPGSIFKVLVMSAALDAGVVEPDTKCDICDGPLKVDKYYIRTWNNEYRPDSTMRDVIVHSDNVGMAFVGQKLGADKLYDYLSKFGIGKPTGIDLQGEAAVSLREKGTWNIVDLSTASFGQGVAATPVQMLTAVAAVANDGVLMKPQVVDELIFSGWREDIEPIKVTRVISEKTADEITQMLADAAESGEAKWTHLSGFRVAGKTGTAQIPIAGHYDEEKTIASFVGFAPHEDPEFVMLVTLREPETSPWASETAAPLWYSLAKDLFIHFGIQPDN